MADTKHEILEKLARRESSVQDLALELGMTVAGVRQHVSALEAQGLVTFRKRGREANRPTHLYRLSDAGKAALPKRYDLLAEALVESAKAEQGEASVRRMLERAGAQVAMRLPQATATAEPHLQRRQTLERLEHELGWRGEVVEDPAGALSVTLFQCPFQSVSKRHPEVCPAFFAGLFGGLFGRGQMTCEPVSEGIACCRIAFRP